MAKILITGGTGSIGKELITQLIGQGHQPVILSRSAAKNPDHQTFVWDPAQGYIDERAFDGIEHIINLAGNGIAEKRWTRSRKEDIINSRILGVKVLYDHLIKLNIRPLSFIGASAIGYYGMHTSEKIYNENDKASNDFLGTVCKQWEKSYEGIEKLVPNFSVVRIGIVLADNGGVYSKMIRPVKMNLGVVLGNGKQYMPWIHVEDLVRIFTHIISGSLRPGIYNAVASQHVSNSDFTKALAASVNKTIILPKLPAFLLKAALGEMSCIVLEGSRVSNQKLIDAGFKFTYNDLTSALSSLAKS